MSLSLVQSRALLGMQAHPVCVEVHLANGLPSFTLVGLAETEVKAVFLPKAIVQDMMKGTEKKTPS